MPQMCRRAVSQARCSLRNADRFLKSTAAREIICKLFIDNELTITQDIEVNRTFQQTAPNQKKDAALIDLWIQA